MLMFHGCADGVFWGQPDEVACQCFRDALLVCFGDTLMSVMSGFAVFAMVGVLSENLGASVQDVIQSDVGMTFIVYPAALLSFPVPSLWCILFFLMLVLMGLGTTFRSVKKLVCSVLYSLGSVFL